MTFTGCTKFRVGSTNDEVYEITGDLFDERVSDWTPVPSRTPGPRRRFLFYLRDNTFEVDAQDWRIERLEPVAG